MSDQEKMREEREKFVAEQSKLAILGIPELLPRQAFASGWQSCAAHYERHAANLEESAKTWHGRYTSACQQHADRLARAGGEIIALEENLAAAQADNVRLRDALQYASDVLRNNRFNLTARKVDEALAQPLDTSALDSMLAEAREEGVDE